MTKNVYLPLFYYHVINQRKKSEELMTILDEILDEFACDILKYFFIHKKIKKITFFNIFYKYLN